MVLPEALPPAAANSLSAAETSSVLQRLSREILSEGFSRVESQGDFELWSANREVEDFRHGVYLEANCSCTVAAFVIFALAPKQALFSAGRPLLLPMSPASIDETRQVRSALDEHLRLLPPHRLPR
jgi:hypothetical protein